MHGTNTELTVDRGPGGYGQPAVSHSYATERQMKSPMRQSRRRSVTLLFPRRAAASFNHALQRTRLVRLLLREDATAGQAGRVAELSSSGNMRVSAIFVALGLLFLSSCGHSTSTKFLSSFSPAALFGKVGGPENISYFNVSSDSSSGKNLFSGVRIDKDWTFGFEGSQAQLLKQLEKFRAEVENQLASAACVISGRGKWSGNFSGFSFEYRSGGRKGFIRVTGVSFESGKQGIDILVYEY